MMFNPKRFEIPYLIYLVPVYMKLHFYDFDTHAHKRMIEHHVSAFECDLTCKGHSTSFCATIVITLRTSVRV